MAERSSHQARHPQSLKSKTAVQLRQEILQAAASHRERLLSAQGLPAHRYALRQAGAKLSRLDLSGCRYPLVDLMSLDPSPTGSVRLEGERSFSPSGRYVEHTQVRVDPMGTGVGKTFVINSMDLYKECDFSCVRISAGDVAGGYVWARLGFLPYPRDWDALRRQIATKIEQFGAGIPPPVLRVLNGALNNSDPRGIWTVARCRSTLADDEYHLGKRLLAGTTWAGEFDLNSDDAWAQLRDAYGQETS